MGKLEVNKEEKKLIKQFEKKIDYKFRDRVKLKRALTHKSYAYEVNVEYADHNERYEYLGDAVIELCISRILFEAFPDKTEGELSRMRAAAVNEGRLAKIAKQIDLGEHLFLGKGEEGTGGREKPSILSDAFEALCGAIFLDRGFKTSEKFIARIFKDVLAIAGEKSFMCDHKTRLQEEVQARFKIMPKYNIVGTKGPDHSKTFEVELFIGEELYGKGEGRTKKAAEQEAAKAALKKMNEL